MGEYAPKTPKNGRQSPRYVYEGSFFMWHNRPILLMRQIETYGFIELIRLLGPQEMGYFSYITSFLTFVIESRPTLYIVKLS